MGGRKAPQRKGKIMTRADIYETILYYTRRAEEDAETIQSKKSQIATEFHTERIKLSTNKIQIFIEKLKTVDKEERKENEATSRYVNKWYNVKTVKERK